MNLTNPTDLGEDRFYRIDGYEAYHGRILWSASFFDRIPMMMRG